ncbi:MAG: hypothetical protein OEY85_14660, partial [Rhodospirillales bacterium]|nr:hypothetical protein [Rhodospirillales bacterium]
IQIPVSLGAEAESIPLDRTDHVHGLAGIQLYRRLKYPSTPRPEIIKTTTANTRQMAAILASRCPMMGGMAWRHISDGIDGPVDFLALTVNSKNPVRGLQRHPGES